MRLSEKSLQEVSEQVDAHIKEIESTNANRNDSSLRVAITNLFKRVSARSTFSNVRGKKGSRAEPIPLSEISKSPIEPTKTKVMDIHLGSRLETAAAEEEE